MTSGDIEKSLTPKLHGIAEVAPVRITNDELYRRSTQYRFWSFTKDELIDLRTKVNRKGELSFKRRIDSLDKDNCALILKYVADGDGDDPDTNGFKKITLEEEREIVLYYARKCHVLAKFFNFSSQVRLSAVSFLLRFYLVHSIMDYYPQQIMYTCLFLSGKSENHFIGIKNFSNAIPKTSPESILQYEYLILDTMRFTLMCHHPLRPLYGFYLDIQNVLIKLDFNRLCKDYEASKTIIEESIFTDAQFLYTPPQIALAALYIVDDVVCMRYLMRKFGVKRKQMLEKMDEVEKEKLNGDVADGTPNPEVKQEEEINTDGKTIVANTPLEQYEKMLSIVKACAEELQNKIDPTVDQAKLISIRAHFTLDPVKYFEKVTKKKNPPSSTAITSNVTASTESVSPAPAFAPLKPLDSAGKELSASVADTGVKREREDDPIDASAETKRIKTEAIDEQ